MAKYYVPFTYEKGGKNMRYRMEALVNNRFFIFSWL